MIYDVNVHQVQVPFSSCSDYPPLSLHRFDFQVISGLVFLKGRYLEVREQLTMLDHC